jgi:hypothetical protein
MIYTCLPAAKARWDGRMSLASDEGHGSVRGLPYATIAQTQGPMRTQSASSSQHRQSD